VQAKQNDAKQVQAKPAAPAAAAGNAVTR